jgi:hypothetical protein
MIVRMVTGQYRLQSLLQFGAKTAKLAAFFATFRPKQLNVIMNLYKQGFRPATVSQQLQNRLLGEIDLELAIGETQLEIECDDYLTLSCRFAGISKQAAPELALEFKFVHCSGIEVWATVEEKTFSLLSVSQIHVYRKYDIFGQGWSKLGSPDDIRNDRVESFLCRNVLQIRGVSAVASPHLKQVIECAKEVVDELTPILETLRPPSQTRRSKLQYRDVGEEIQLELDSLTIDIEGFDDGAGEDSSPFMGASRMSELTLIKQPSMVVKHFKKGNVNVTTTPKSAPTATLELKLIIFKLSGLTREVLPDGSPLPQPADQADAAPRLFPERQAGRGPVRVGVGSANQPRRSK